MPTLICHGRTQYDKGDGPFNFVLGMFGVQATKRDAIMKHQKKQASY